MILRCTGPSCLRGIAVFSDQCYDADGKRLCGHSTGKTTKTEAWKECVRLLQLGLLVPEKQKMPTFAEYAEGWWDFETCDHLKNQQGRKDITEAYANNCKAMVKNQILPYFGKTPLDKITIEAINEWLLGFKERKVVNADDTEKVKSYKNSYANTVFGTFWLMLNEATNRKIIATKSQDYTYDGTMRLFEQSLRHLQTDHLDLYQHHFLNSQTLRQLSGRDSARTAFEKLRTDGVVRFLGVTAHS
jgi:hypothetical protein